MDFTFDNLQGADRVMVTTNLNRTLTKVEDAETIGKIVALIKTYQTGWYVPAEGVPVADVRLNFYKGDRPLGNVGIGLTFLTAHQLGGFYSKKSDPTERKKVLALVGLEDYGSIG